MSRSGSGVVVRRRVRRVVVGVVVVGVVGGLGAYAVRGGVLEGVSFAADGDGGDGERPVIHAVEVGVGDLVETESARGELGFGSARLVSSPSGGTVTAVVGGDERLVRGDVIFEVDAVPSVVFFGDAPMYRRLERGVGDGRDVQIVEVNLAALGFGAKHDLLVDRHFDRATERAIRDFEAAVGAPVDGRLDPGQVTVLSGPGVVDSLDVELGTLVQEGSPVLSVTSTESVSAVVFADDGVVSGLPAVGTVLGAGEVAFKVGDVSTAVMLGELSPGRTLSRGRVGGPDVLQLEQNLDRLGIKDRGELEVDSVFDVHTEAAWRNWERWFGHRVDGKASVGDYVVVPADTQVSRVAVVDGDDVERGEVAFEVAKSNRLVHAKIDAAHDDLLGVGDLVTVEFPDDTKTQGTITEIDASTTTDESDGSVTTGFDVNVAELPDRFVDRYRVEVKVDVVSKIAKGAVVVPASALLSTGNGKYAVEIVDGTSTKFVGVDPGLFAAGNVAVTGIEAGTAVVVPQ